MRRVTLSVTAGAVLVSGMSDAAQVVAPSKARYQMDVSTTSGLMAGGVNPMKMLFGKGLNSNAVAHMIDLRLGSTLAAAGAPAADHFMPAGMMLGASVPLLTPTPGSPEPTTSDPSKPGKPGEVRRPRGRLLLYWGCGAHAAPGQPVVIDFGKIEATRFPPGLFSMSVPADPGPTAATSRTFGFWPNDRSNKQPRPSSSLIGEHRVAGNYSPEIRFALDQDFMAPLQAQVQEQPDGSQMLSWNAIPVATGYYAWLIGAKSMGDDSADMVWWTSAGGREFGAGLTDWVAPAVVANLIGRRVVLPPSQTNCQIPAEVKGAGGGFQMAQLFAYGPERNFAFPARPANPKVAWRPDWTARVRYRANTALLIGMPGISGGERKKCKPRITFGGIKPC